MNESVRFPNTDQNVPTKNKILLGTTQFPSPVKPNNSPVAFNVPKNVIPLKSTPPKRKHL